jgi:monoterpene epsilon-lactone hydrolase
MHQHHPDVQRLLDAMEGWPDTSQLSRADAAHLEDAFSEQLTPTPPDTQVSPVNAGGVAAEWIIAPEAEAERVVLYLHGGGYIYGSIGSYRGWAARLSQLARARVLLLDYRLAPEHPFPAAVDDTVAAYRWLLAEGFAPERVSIGGESAGGGLTVAALLALRDAGDPLPACGVCISPWTDLTLASASMSSRAETDPFCDRPGLEDMATKYLHGADPRTPLASPLFAELAGLPPLLIQVGDCEVLLDDAAQLAERASAAGVETLYECYAGMTHNFPLFGHILPDGDVAAQRIGGFIRERTG